VEFTRKVSDAVAVPVIACGGAGKLKDFEDVIQEGHADAVSAASCFHYYYATPPGDDRRWMSFDESKLRMGSDIDSGNIDFLKDGYGGYRDIMVDRVAVPGLKRYLIEKEIPVRPLTHSQEVIDSSQTKSGDRYQKDHQEDQTERTWQPQI